MYVFFIFGFFFTKTVFMKNYTCSPQYLKQALSEGMNLVTLNQEPFHYGSHYSNSGTVLHFLVRLPPFTSMFLNYQGNVYIFPITLDFHEFVN